MKISKKIIAVLLVISFTLLGNGQIMFASEILNKEDLLEEVAPEPFIQENETFTEEVATEEAIVAEELQNEASTNEVATEPIVTESLQLEQQMNKIDDFQYYINETTKEILYREYIDPRTKKILYAEEYYPGTVYLDQDFANGKKKWHIVLDNNEQVLYRVLLNKDTQVWQEIEEYYTKRAWKYGYPYGHALKHRFYLEPDKTIKFAYEYASGNYTTPTARYEYIEGAKYDRSPENSHGKKIKRKLTTNWNTVIGEFNYVMNYTGEVLYREHLHPNTKKRTYAEEYYPGTIYKLNNLDKGKKTLYIALDDNEQVLYRVLLNKDTQVWEEIEEYYTKRAWKYGYPYGHELKHRFYLEPDKTIKFAYEYASGNYTTPTVRYEYADGTKYDRSPENSHGKKIKRKLTTNWNTVIGEFNYVMNYTGEVLYREHLHPNTKKRTYAEEYYPGTIYKLNNLDKGKKKRYIALDDNEQVLYRVLLNKDTQAWEEIEEYYTKRAWKYGYPYGHELKHRFYLEPDKTIKFAYEYASGNYTTPTVRYEYADGTKYDRNPENSHGKKIKRKLTTNWNTVIGEFNYVMNYTGEVLYRDHLHPNTKKRTYAEEYYPGTIYKLSNLDKGKKKRYIALDGNERVLYRVLLNKNTQAWEEIEEYYTKHVWKYGYPYGHELQYRFYIHPDKTIKFAYGYNPKNYTTPVVKYLYFSGTKYGQNHGSRISEVISLIKTNDNLHKPVSRGIIYCILESCMDGHYGQRHNGADISNNGGATVYSIGEGIVDISQNFGGPDGLGNTIGIIYEIKGKTYYVVYAHLESRNVQVGQKVSRGQNIGIVGQTGCPWGGKCNKHLHFEILNTNYWIGNPATRRKYALPITELFPKYRLRMWL